MNATTAWRMVELTDDGRIKTLFHGVQGCRTLEMGKWYDADIKRVRDGGTSGTRVGSMSFLTVRE